MDGRARARPACRCRQAPTPTLCFLPQAAAVAAVNLQANLLTETSIMKSIILWLCGVPVIVIIGLKVFGVF